MSADALGEAADRPADAGFDPVRLFRRSAARWPEREALRIAGRSITYRELDQWSDAIAEAVLAAAAPNERIGLIAHKLAETYAAILGTLKARCAYVPFPVDGPAARWERMVTVAQCRFQLGAGPAIRALRRIDIPEAKVPSTTLPEAHGADEAYVLFTSGSTGGPKGVSVSRANIAAYLRHMVSSGTFNETDRFSQFFALTFDLSVHDLFVCWGAGACLCVPTEEGALHSATFAREERISAWFSVPSLPALLDRMRSLKPGTLPDVKHAFFCGEGLPYSVARAFALAAPNAQLTNLYGPTEATIAITAHRLDRDHLERPGLVPIGLPFPGHKAIIHEEELCLTGPQISNGYIGLPEANAVSFADITGTGERWYRTGDRARMDTDGTLHYLGRVDHQLKVAGHRVEPGEVDEVLTPLLSGGAAVTVPVQETGGTRLVTFINVARDTSALLAHCRAHLPAYMVPERILVLDAFPLTAHGKTDRQQLMALAQHE